MQYLVTELEKNKYVYLTMANFDDTNLEDVFFAHAESINFLNTLPIALVMDSTHKINLYRLPFFEIVGVISNKETYYVDFVFLAYEKEGSFTWILEMLVGLWSSKLNMPKVIVTNRDTTLMNVVAKVLPKNAALLCHCHTKKNVRTKTDYKVKPNPKNVKVDGKDKEVKEVKEVKASDIVNNIMRAWDDVV